MWADSLGLRSSWIHMSRSSACDLSLWTPMATPPSWRASRPSSQTSRARWWFTIQSFGTMSAVATYVKPRQTLDKLHR